jgi:outer membrane protein insertion porin family
LTTDVAGLGGSVAYLRNRLDAGVYFPLTEELVLAVLGSGGHVLGLGEDVRLLDRYFIGGDDLRGFAIDGVGPRDVGTDDAVGGKYFYTGTVQLTFPLGFPEEFKIRGRVFNDFGSAWGLDDSAPGVEDPASVRTSVGAGLTWVSPFGPLGIDLGFALVKESFDDTEILRVNFGTRF